VSRQWSSLPERGTPFALELILWIGVRVGRRAGRLLLYPIAVYFFLTTTARRRASLEYLARVLDRKPRWWDVVRHYHCFAATILDRVYLLAGEFDRFDIRVHGGETLLKQVRSGQGCMLLGSHLGSFEVLRVLGVTRGNFPLKILMNVDHNQRITQFMNALNPDLADTIIPIRGPETLLKVKESLEKGVFIGTLGDRLASGDKVVRCRFLGEKARFPAGNFLLSAMMGCPVILVFGLYRGGNRYDVHLELLTAAVAAERNSRQQAIQYWAQCYAERLEYYARSAPYNWFNFYSYWNDD
jgi:predicted LPLAT superfamily acyltransferase